MDYRKLNEEIEKFLEGEVISFMDYKRQKAADRITADVLKDVDTFKDVDTGKNEVNIKIQSIKVKWCEGFNGFDLFEEGETYDFNHFQDLVYLGDYICQKRDDVLKLAYIANINLNGEEDTYEGRLYLGEGEKHVNIINNMKNFIEESTQEKINIINKQPEYNSSKYDKEAVKYLKKEEPQETKTNLAAAKDYGAGKTSQDVQVGDILTCTWGYSMTLVDFYKVIERKKASIKLVNLKDIIVDGDGMSGKVVPTNETEPDQYVDGKLFRIGTKWSKDIVCQVNGHSVYYWDGKPKTFDRWD